MKGIDYIGPCKSPSMNTRHKMDDILRPLKLDHNHLTWAKEGQIEILLGGNHARLIVRDDNNLNEIFKSANLGSNNLLSNHVPLHLANCLEYGMGTRASHQNNLSTVTPSEGIRTIKK